MNRAQRVVAVGYCLLLTYCCVWVPWRIPIGLHDRFERSNYGWIWAGPHPAPAIVYNPPIQVPKDFQLVAEEDPSIPLTSSPDIPRILLRIVAATAFACAAFLLMGLLRTVNQRS